VPSRDCSPDICWRYASSSLSDPRDGLKDRIRFSILREDFIGRNRTGSRRILFRIRGYEASWHRGFDPTNICRIPRHEKLALFAALFLALIPVGRMARKALRHTRSAP
jgi:hypothetical protein